MRLSNSGEYESPYGPAPMNWRCNDLIFHSNQLRFRPRTDHPPHWGGNDLFSPMPCVLTIIPAALSSSHLRCNQSGPRHTEKVGYGKKLGHKNLWLLKMGHGTKKVENQWYKLIIISVFMSRSPKRAYLYNNYCRLQNHIFF